MLTERRALPDRRTALRIGVVGCVLIALGLTLAAFTASNIAAADARDLPFNTWFWELGQSNPWIYDVSGAISWFADGARSTVIVPVVAVVLFGLRQWRWALFFIVVSQGGLIISNLLKFTVARERPPFIENDTLQQHLSFPSGHTFAGFTIWAAMAIIAWYLLPRRAAIPVSAITLAIGLLQGPTRLVVGKHWVTDIAGSWLLGLGWLLLVWSVYIWWRSRGAESGYGSPSVVSRES